ncbi:MAG: hypothetical protein WAM30_11925, partial [Candidatus Dormiibacterota bacterium]
MTTLRTLALPDDLRTWLAAPAPGSTQTVAGLPRAAWAPVAAAAVRTAHDAGHAVLVLAPNPGRLLEELRPWLAGTPRASLFAEVSISFLDRPPAFDQAVSQRVDALVKLAGRESGVVVSSRRAMQRATLDVEGLRQARVELAPGLHTDPRQLAARFVELGYSREALAEAPGQFAIRGGIVDVFPAGASSPVRA